jgi:hypothetical protein
MMRPFVLAALAALTVGCTDSGSSNSSSSLAALTAPTAAQAVESFSGTVAAGSSDAHTFIVTAGNQPVLVTLTAAGPPTTIFMGVGVGTPASDGMCALFSNASVLAQAGMTAQLSGTIAAGTYCVAVFDAGNQSGPVDYTVTVSHS